MAYKKLKINRELIPNSVLKATNCDIKPIESQNSGIMINRYKVDTNSILDVFFNLDGTTTMTCSGKEPGLAELVASEIKDNCEVDLPEPTRALYLKGFSQEKFDTIIQRFKSHNLTVTSSEDTVLAKRYTISNTTNESIKVHYFPSTGALNFQGRGYTIYSDLLEGLGDWVSVDDVIGSNLAANNIESITKDDLMKSMQDALPSSYGFLQGAIANIMSSSFFLTKIENEGLPDYSWMVFPILRGFEGAIKKMLILKGIIVNRTFGEVFEPVSNGSTTYKFLNCHSTAINDNDYCNLLTNCYNYICANRHGIFHVNGVINSTRMLSRESAIEMFNEIIELIEDTYSKVKSKVVV